MFFSPSCLGYFKKKKKTHNGPTFLPHAVSQILWGLAQAPGDEPLPLALLVWVPMPWDLTMASQHP